MAATTEDFSKGERVEWSSGPFGDEPVRGTIIRVNRKTLSVQPDDDCRYLVGVNEGGWVNVYPEYLNSLEG